MGRERRRATELRVDFVKGEGRRYRSLLHRADGVTVAFDGGAFNAVGGPAGEVPHDLAHLIVENELELRDGVWGVLAAGGMFRHATAVAGRQAPHAARRGRALVDAAGDRIMRAEILTRAVCDVSAGTAPPGPDRIRRAVGERWWSDTVTAAAIERACRRLRAGGVDWAELAPGAALTDAWLHGPVPG